MADIEVERCGYILLENLLTRILPCVLALHFAFDSFGLPCVVLRFVAAHPYSFRHLFDFFLFYRRYFRCGDVCACFVISARIENHRVPYV